MPRALFGVEPDADPERPRVFSHRGRRDGGSEIFPLQPEPVSTFLAPLRRSTLASRFSRVFHKSCRRRQGHLNRDAMAQRRRASPDRARHPRTQRRAAPSARRGRGQHEGDGQLRHVVAGIRCSGRGHAGVAGIDVPPPASVFTRDGVRSCEILFWPRGVSPHRQAAAPRPVFPLKARSSPSTPDLITARRRRSCLPRPRGREVVAGATSEHAGFDTTASGKVSSRSSRPRGHLPSLGRARHCRWAGLRPATEDMLPILGEDPESPS